MPSTSDHSWLCVIGGSASHVPFVEAAKAMNHCVLVLDRDPNAPAASIADTFHKVSVQATGELVSDVSMFAAEHDLRGCMTYVSHPAAHHAVAQIVKALNLPGPSERAVDLTWNKESMHAALVAAGLLVPDTMMVSDVEALTPFLEKHGTALIKPAAGGTGSEGLALVTKDHAKGEVEKAREASSNSRVKAEAYMQGQEYSVDGVVQSGKLVYGLVSAKYTAGPKRNFVIEGFATGKGVSDNAEADALRAVVGHAVSALEIDDSFVSFDIIQTGDGPVIIDAGMLLDAKIDRLLTFASMDVYALRCHLAAGADIAEPLLQSAWHSGYALRFMYADHPGTLMSQIDGDAVGRDSDRRRAVEWERRVGDDVKKPTSVADIVGWLLVEDDDATRAWSRVLNMDNAACFSVESTP